MPFQPIVGGLRHGLTGDLLQSIFSQAAADHCQGQGRDGCQKQNTRQKFPTLGLQTKAGVQAGGFGHPCPCQEGNWEMYQGGMPNHSIGILGMNQGKNQGINLMVRMEGL